MSILKRAINAISDWLSKPLALGVMVILFIGILLFTMNAGWDMLLRQMNFITFTPETRVTDTRTLVNSVKPLGQLVTVSYQHATADTHVQINRGPFNSCQQSADFAYVVEVQAGIDLTSLDESQIAYDEEAETYTLTLPKPGLTSCNVYENFSRYAQHMPIGISTCTRHHDNEFQMLGEIQVIYTTRNFVLENGILEDAQVQTEKTLRTFLTALTDKDVIIQYEDTPPQYHSSCAPQTPQGWLSGFDGNEEFFWTPAQ